MMTRVRRTAVVVAVGLLVLVLAACGSRMNPDEVAKATGQNGGGGSSGDGGGTAGLPGTTGDTGSIPGGTDTGSGPGTTGNTGNTGTNTPGNTGTNNNGGPTSPTNPGGEQAPTGTVKAGSCAGFKNGTGITDKEITIANVSDIGGPVPGIFEMAQQATRAYVEYFNRSSSVCGRKLKILNLDSRADSGADQAGYVQACSQAFAAVGSMSAFDSGGAATAANCGLPDLRSTIVNPERQKCGTCFGAYAIKTNMISDPAAKWLAKKYPDAVKNAAFLYVNAGAAPLNAQSLAEGYKKMAGWNPVMVQGIDVAEFNYAPYVQQMKSKGVKGVIYYGAYQMTVKLQKAMEQQGFKPDFYMQDPTIYNADYVSQAGSAGEGSYVFSANDMFENKANKEVQLYLAWLQQVKPGAVPGYYGLYAWSAARLFVEKAIQLGGKLNRASMVSALKGVTNWTGNGAHTAMNLKTGITSPCLKMLQLSGGTWKQVSPGNYMCGRVADSGVGG